MSPERCVDEIRRNGVEGFPSVEPGASHLGDGVQAVDDELHHLEVGYARLRNATLPSAATRRSRQRPAGTSDVRGPGRPDRRAAGAGRGGRGCGGPSEPACPGARGRSSRSAPRDLRPAIVDDCAMASTQRSPPVVARRGAGPRERALGSTRRCGTAGPSGSGGKNGPNWTCCRTERYVRSRRESPFHRSTAGAALGGNWRGEAGRKETVAREGAFPLLVAPLAPLALPGGGAAVQLTRFACRALAVTAPRGRPFAWPHPGSGAPPGRGGLARGRGGCDRTRRGSQPPRSRPASGGWDGSRPSSAAR